MNLFKLKTTWSAPELGLLKICLLSVGILFGTRWHDFFYDHIYFLLAVAGVTILWALLLWIKKAGGNLPAEEPPINH